MLKDFCARSLLLFACAAGATAQASPQPESDGGETMFRLVIPKIDLPPDPGPGGDAEPGNRAASRPASGVLEAQVELARRGFSSGPIDGVMGPQTEAAVIAFQESQDLTPTGRLDPQTLERLQLSTPALGSYTVTEADVARLRPLGATWTEKSEQPVLDYETVVELVAERFHANPKLIRNLNPGVDVDNAPAGTTLVVPDVERVSVSGKTAHLHLRLADHVLEARDDAGRIVAHFPVSIAQSVEKRPLGELHVTVVVPNPDYTFDPATFPESEEAQAVGRRLRIAPGPNNPVGTGWIGLDRPGYGIHGTPIPEHVGRTESHGCFRLANWDIETLIPLAWVGLPVFIGP